MIEKRKVILTKEENDNYIDDLLCFGYEVTYKEKEKVNKETLRVFMLERDTDIPNYDKLVELEKEYEDNKKELVMYPKINGWLVFFLWCLIIPGMIYYDLKSNDIKAIDQHNEPLLIKMYDLTEEARKLKEEK
ncbi:MAG: hypothetical protein J6Y28_01950 [Acholeplasmatales bacterium]|nr:hypothetical protein [Acholeplasmatales bacterium]